MTRQMDAPAESSRDTLSNAGGGIGTSAPGVLPRLECLWGHDAPYVVLAEWRCDGCGHVENTVASYEKRRGDVPLPAEVCRECVKRMGHCFRCGTGEHLRYAQAAPQ